MINKHPGGRPVLFTNDANGLQAFKDKISKCEKRNIKQVALFLGITRPTLYSIVKRGEEWKKAVYES